MRFSTSGFFRQTMPLGSLISWAKAVSNINSYSEIFDYENRQFSSLFYCHGVVLRQDIVLFAVLLFCFVLYCKKSRNIGILTPRCAKKTPR
jgi:hypothetical protein